MPRLKQIQDGEWVTPIMRGYRLECCDCGLVHRVNFKGTGVRFQLFRLPKKKK